MRIQIMGAGALGSLIGALIQLSGFEVIFVARGLQLEALKKSLKISGLMNAELKVKAEALPQNADITFFLVKAYDTEDAAKILSECDAGIVCSLQNGIGNAEILAKYFDEVVMGVTSYAANLVEYGHVMFAGRGYTYIGNWVGNGAEEVASVFKKSGIHVEVVKDIERRIWLKAAINAVINPITALCRVRNGKIIENFDLNVLAKKLAMECENVLKKMGYEFKVYDEVKKVAEMTAMNRSSMLQDVMKGKKTEIDYINGVFVKKATELGLESTANEIVWRLIRAYGDS